MPVPSSIPAAPNMVPSTLDFKTIYHALKERFWLILLCFIMAGLVTAWLIKRAPVIFAATTTFMVEQDEQRVLKFEKVQQEDTRGLEVLRTIEQTLKSRPLLERVLATNNLMNDPTFFSSLEPASKEQLIGMLAKMADVRLRRGTRLIDVSVSHTNPRIAERVANSMVREYIRQNYERYAESTLVANQFLLEEGEKLKRKLQQSETALQAYKEKTKSVSLEERQDIVTTKLKELSHRVTQAKSERTRLEVEVAQLKQLGDDATALFVLPVVSSDPSVTSMQNALTRMENDFATLRQRYKEKHPKYIQAITQLNDLRNSFTNAILKVPQTVAAALASATAAEQALELALKDQERTALDLNKSSIQFNVLARDVQSDRAMYESVLNRLKETDLTKELETSKIRIIQPAVTPELPVSPDRKKMLTRGLLAGLAVGILLALTLNSLDSSLKTVDQIEEYLKLPVLSAVPSVKNARNEKTKIVVSEDAHSRGAEAFRTLRTALSMLGKADQRRVFMFTSALPQEGKTFSSVNYSVSLAQQNLRTLLIDADLRRPAVEKAIKGERTQHVGVTDFLTGQKHFKDIVQTGEQKNFFYITAGTTAPNPAELLGQGTFNQLIDEALQHFDRVVIDSAPVHAVSDSLLILERVQTICLLVRSGGTPRRAVQRAVQMLQKAGGPVAGIILNRVPGLRGRFYGYNPYYDYSYTQKYGEKGVYGT